MRNLYLRSTIQDMLDELMAAYGELYDELENRQERTDGYIAQDLVVLNKALINTKAEKLIAVAKVIKQLKEHNPRKA